jgi:hypothetical protein
MKEWDAVGVVAEGEQITISGLNLWSFDWTRLPEAPVELPHPQHQTQRHLMRVFEIKSGNVTLRFAAGEVSAGVWAFYQSNVR